MSSLDRTTSSTRLKDPGRMTIGSVGRVLLFSRKEDGEELLRITRDFCSYSWCIARCFFLESSFFVLFFVQLFSFPRKIEFENSSCSVLGQLPERQLRFKEEDRGMKNLLESPIFYDWIFQVDFPRLDSKFKVLWRERCWRVVKHLD